MCGRELPLGAPSAAACPLTPAALRGTGKDSLKFENPHLEAILSYQQEPGKGAGLWCDVLSTI